MLESLNTEGSEVLELMNLCWSEAIPIYRDKPPKAVHRETHEQQTK